MTELNIGRPVRPPTPRVRMTTGRFARLFFTDNFARFYLVTSVGLTVAAIAYFGITPGMVVASLVSFALLSLLEYVIHRWLLHNQIFYRHPFTARIWRHLHYAHHMDPTETGGMIGPPQYAIPVMLLVTLPLGWLIGGAAGAAGASAVGFWLVLAYEYCHGYAHLVTEPRTRYGKMLRHLHMLHHFHNEKGNFGVTSPVFDLMFGTYYSDPAKMARCATARNLGYTAEQARRYPWAGQDDAKPAE
jgi:sterol desaturase/sphingolipid hydroxylase (fatty acid hydroxylase superfamily)